MKTIALIGKGRWGVILQKYIPEHFICKYVVDSKFDKNTIWDDKDVEAVIIATPIPTHYTVAKEALLHGKHVFMEKPITLRYEEAEELRDLAIKNGLKIGVDFTLTFSKSIKYTIDTGLGDLLWFDMWSKKMGNCNGVDVFNILGSHYLAVLGSIIPLKTLDFSKKCIIFDDREGACSTGMLMSDKGVLNVSMDSPHRDFGFVLYGTDRVFSYSKDGLGEVDRSNGNVALLSFDESNNVGYAIEYFCNLLSGKVESNLDLALDVTKILESSTCL